jgi:putative ABC transport system permease protein
VDPRARRPNRLTGVGQLRNQLRSEPVGRTALVAGIAAAAAAFTALCMNASALTVQMSGQLPDASPRRAYDILVRVPSHVTQQSDGGSLARPADLAELTGGITLAQYDTIRRLPGVQVAAPMTMIGYVPLTVVIPVAIPASALTATPALFTVTAQQRSDDGLTATTERIVGATYVSADQTPPAVCSSAVTGAVAASSRLATCWSTTTGPQLQTWSGPQPSAVSVPLAWTFLLPLVAVDPRAEARLLQLNGAVVQGTYLPATATRSGPVPVIMASSIDDDAQDDIGLAQLPASVAQSYGADLSARQAGTLLSATPGETVAKSTVTASKAYADLLAYLRGSAAVRVSAYWTPSPARYVVGAGRVLTPLSVQSDAGFRTLTLHTARSGTGSAGYGAASTAGAALKAVGVFDPARIQSSATTPSPYLGEQLSAADTRTRRLLDNQTLGPDGNPAGYPGAGATLVMPLQDIGAFTAASAYSRTDATAPIGSVRVRVAGGAGDDAVSLARVRMVAQEIVRATGLHVQVTLAASAAMRTVDLAAGQEGRPALLLREVWYRSDVGTTVSPATDPRSVALSAVVLLIGSAFVGSAVMATTRKRRRELATLRALGWRRRRVAWRFGQDFVVAAACAGLVAALTVYLVEATMGARLDTVWPLLSVPASVAMTLGAGWLPLRRATADAISPGRARSPRLAGRAARSTAGPLSPAAISLRRAPWRLALRLVVTVGACAAFGLEFAVRWAFGGVIVGSWLGFPVSWQDGPVDLAAVITIVLLALVAMTDIGWRNGADWSADLRTLRAIGWSAYGVARLAAGEALLLGLAGGLLASALDVAGIIAIVHQPPPSLAVVAMAVIGLGVTLSLISTSLSALVERATRALA